MFARVAHADSWVLKSTQATLVSTAHPRWHRLSWTFRFSVSQSGSAYLEATTPTVIWLHLRENIYFKKHKSYTYIVFVVQPYCHEPWEKHVQDKSMHICSTTFLFPHPVFVCLVICKLLCHNILHLCILSSLLKYSFFSVHFTIICCVLSVADSDFSPCTVYLSHQLNSAV